MSGKKRKETNEVEDDPNVPSTSSKKKSKFMSISQHEREEIVNLWKKTDETLEEKAKSLNLTPLNVKTILHHLIKYPNAFDALIGVNTDSEFPDRKILRSQSRQTDNDNNVFLMIESLTNNTPKTVLNYDFDENDEFDEDYTGQDKEDDDDDESEDDEEVDDEDDIEEDLEGEEEIEDLLDPYDQMDLEEYRRNEKLGESSINLNNSLVRNYVDPIESINEDSLSREYRSHASPGYREFINAVLDENGKEVNVTQDDTDEDEDYNVLVDNNDMTLDLDTWYDTRHDRATEIPRTELESLYMDTILAEKEIPVKVLPKEAISMCEKVDSTAPSVQSRKSIKEQDAEAAEMLHKNLANESMESCTLLRGDNVTFRQSEIAQLKIQLEQHVQLLTQFVVVCYCDPNMANVKNDAQLMINELDDNYHKYGDNSIYNISNLGESIATCHDIIKATQVEPEYVQWAKNTDGVLGAAIRPEAVAVLSSSNAIKYPNLLPKVQPVVQDSPVPFTRSEDLMLAFALLQFAHLPRRSGDLSRTDRYNAISLHCLPVRPPATIRNHMKTMRLISHNSSPMHLIISQAEQGICKIEFPPPTYIYIDGNIHCWPDEYQPGWYKMFFKKFKVSQNFKISPIDETQGKLVVTPTKKMEVRKTPEIVVDKKEEKEINLDETRYIKLGTVGETEQPVIMERAHVAHLVNQLFPREHVSPSKRRKMHTPKKYVNEEGNPHIGGKASCRKDPESSSHSPSAAPTPTVFDEESHTRFSPPVTPGKGDYTDFDMVDSGSLCSFDAIQYQETCSSRMTMIPRTPRGLTPADSLLEGITTGSWTTDFSQLHKCTQLETGELKPKIGGQKSVEKRHVEFEHEYEEIVVANDGNEKCSTTAARKRKRSRVEKEQMGQKGFDDDAYRSAQMNALAKRVMTDVEKKLFMHNEKWESLKKIMLADDETKEKVGKIIKLLESLPDVMHLVLLFTPREALPKHILASQIRQSYQAAIEMIIDIDAYITAARIKTPTVRQIFKLIAKIGMENVSSSVEAAERMYELLGNERPLWEKIEKHFWGLAHKDRSKPEDFEYIDLTKEGDGGGFETFEVIDDLDQVMNATAAAEIKQQPRGNMLVRSGQLMVSNKHGAVPVEVVKNNWSRSQDLLLLTNYNKAVQNDPNFKIEDLPQLMTELPFSPDLICSRIELLLSMLK